MEDFVEVRKIIKCTVYSTVFFLFEVKVLMTFGEVVVNRTNYQGCQFDVHFIQCQTSIDISGIANEFVQYVQNYSQYVYPFKPQLVLKR